MPEHRASRPHASRIAHLSTESTITTLSWVDFTRENPRQFRLGVFGDLHVWNPENIEPYKNPDFQNRLVAVKQPPFARGT